jgi:hypothetical protein
MSRREAAPATAAASWPTPQRCAAYALVLLLTFLLAVWGSFLVPFRIGGTLVPVSLLLALLGNVAVGRAGGRLCGTTGALVPGLLWLGVALTLSSRRAEGDIVVPGSPVGLLFLLTGAIGGAVAYGMTVTRTRPRG